MRFVPWLLGVLLAALPTAASAQSLSIDLGGSAGGSTTAALVQIVALVTVLSLAPSILVTVTSFTRMVVVLSLLRSALGIQQTPPNVVLISLALFLTGFVMTPVFTTAFEDGIGPYLEQELDEEQAFEATMAPFRGFMLEHVREQDLALFLDMSGAEPVETAEDVPLKSLIPAFMITELRRAFEIGFLLFLPFLVIDMVVASILMSMGMMMLPPIIVSLPFKLIFFVLVDGWYLLAGSLVKSYGV